MIKTYFVALGGLSTKNMEMESFESLFETSVDSIQGTSDFVNSLNRS